MTRSPCEVLHPFPAPLEIEFPSERGGTGAGAGAGAVGDASVAVLDEEEKLQLARKLLLTTEWIVEAGQKHGQVWG